MKYELNTIGSLLVQKQSKEVIRFIPGGILLFIVFFIGIRFGLEEGSSKVYLYFWAGIISAIISFFGPFYLSNKIKKVVQKIEFFESEIRIETKKDVKNLKNIELRKVQQHFKGFGRGHMNGYIIKSAEERGEYWLIETFFNDMEAIEIELGQFM